MSARARRRRTSFMTFFTEESSVHHLLKALKTLAACLTSLLLLGCGGDATTAPAPVSLVGSWSYSTASDQAGACIASGTTLTFSQSGSTVTGTYSGGTVLCGSSSTAFGEGAITNGIVTGATVAFDINTFHHTGTVSGSTMRGTVVTTNTPYLLSRYPINGAFTAIRQP